MTVGVAVTSVFFESYECAVQIHERRETSAPGLLFGRA